MPYSTSEAFTNKVISLFLYGENSPPADLANEKYLKGARNLVEPIAITMVDFMEGPGRFVRLSHFEMVQKFLNGNVDVSALGVPGVDYTIEAGKIIYNKDQAAQRMGIENRRFAFNQAYFSDGSDDYLDRVFIWGSTSFQLNSDIRFVIDTDGSRYIENAKMTLDLSERAAGRPDTNFDFESGSFTEFFEPFIRPVFDPFDIGLSVGINVTGDVAPNMGHYNYDSYVAERDANQHTLGLTNPSIGTTNGTHDFTSEYAAAGALLAARGFGYIGDLYERNALRYTQDGYNVFFGTDDSDTVYLGYNDPTALLAAHPHLLYAEQATKGAWVVGANGNDSITGIDFADNRLEGGKGDDELVGGRADDELHGDEGADKLYGGYGKDALYADSEDKVLDGGSGIDTVDYSESDVGIDWAAAQTSVSSVEHVIGSSHNDRLELSTSILGMVFDADVTIEGGAGDDRVGGNDAANTLDGEEGDDNIWGRAGNDVIRGGAGNDRIEGGDASYLLASDDDEIYGDAGNDVIDGGEGAGFVRAGQSVAVKLEAFPFTRFGTAPGHVETIGSDAIEDERLGLGYIARIRLDHTKIDRGDRVVPLTPGMAVTADIRTGERSIMSYLISPIDKARQEAGRER